jgi:hypothetical protein
MELPEVKRHRMLSSLGLTAGVAALVVTIVLAVTRNGRAGQLSLPLVPISTIGNVQPAADPGNLGPEGVPIPTAGALARPQFLENAQRIDGIGCQATTTVLFHIHAHLTIFVHGAARRVPAGIGVAPPLEVEETPRGAFVADATCFMWLHTHSSDGIIHTESPVERVYTLGNFFDIWGRPLSRHQVAGEHGKVTAFFDGRVYTGNPRSIPLLAHAQIQLDVGTPLIAPEHIDFPQGL